MIYLRVISLFFLCFFLSAGCSSAQNKSLSNESPAKISEAGQFTSKEGNFSINISQAPLQTRNLGSDAAEKKGIDAGKQFIWKFEKTVYTALYSGAFDADGNALPHDFDDMNIGVRKGIARQGGTLISEKEIFYGKYPGREFRYTASNGVKFIGRNYLIGTMGYQINGGYVDEKGENEVLKVLDSFKLLIEEN